MPDIFIPTIPTKEQPLKQEIASLLKSFWICKLYFNYSINPIESEKAIRKLIEDSLSLLKIANKLNKKPSDEQKKKHEAIS